MEGFGTYFLRFVDIIKNWRQSSIKPISPSLKIIIAYIHELLKVLLPWQSVTGVRGEWVVYLVSDLIRQSLFNGEESYGILLLYYIYKI